MFKGNYKTTKSVVATCSIITFLTTSIVATQSLPADAMRRVEGPLQDTGSKKEPTVKFSQKHIPHGVDTAKEGVGVYATGKATQQAGRGDDTEAFTHVTGQALMFAGTAEAVFGTIEVVVGVIAKLFGN